MTTPARLEKVLITGAGTGFGYEVAMRLAEKDFDVLRHDTRAAARRPGPDPRTVSSYATVTRPPNNRSPEGI